MRLTGLVAQEFAQRPPGFDEGDGSDSDMAPEEKKLANAERAGKAAAATELAEERFRSSIPRQAATARKKEQSFKHKAEQQHKEVARGSEGGRYVSDAALIIKLRGMPQPVSLKNAMKECKIGQLRARRLVDELDSKRKRGRSEAQAQAGTKQEEQEENEEAAAEAGGEELEGEQSGEEEEEGVKTEPKKKQKLAPAFDELKQAADLVQKAKAEFEKKFEARAKARALIAQEQKKEAAQDEALASAIKAALGEQFKQPKKK